MITDRSSISGYRFDEENSSFDSVLMGRTDSGLGYDWTRSTINYVQRDSPTVMVAERSAASGHAQEKKDAATIPSQTLTSRMSIDAMSIPKQVRRRDSVATSSGSSNRKSRNHESLSRRSSTISTKRPTMKRAKTAHGAPSRPMSTQEAIEFHRRSVSLFQNPTVDSSIPSLPLGPYSAPSSPKRESVRPLASAFSTPGSTSPYLHTPPLTSAGIDQDHVHEDDVYEPIPATIMHWTSQDTRRKQYAEIDRMHSGLRGFWLRIAPRWLCPRVPAKFWSEKDTDDNCSVRRHRLTISPESEAGSVRGPGRPGMVRSLSCF